jgi:citrate synthase
MALPSPYFRSSISRIEDGHMNIRGYDHRDLIKHATATEVIFLTLMGRRPTAGECRVLDSIIAAVVDGGFMSAMAVAARYAVSGSASIPAGVAAGMATVGYHTASPQRVAEMLHEIVEASGDPNPAKATDEAIEQAIRSRLDAKVSIPGLGHPTHKTSDPRTEALKDVAEEVGLADGYFALMERVRDAMQKVSGKNLVLNVDGALSALLVEMGFPGEEILAVNIIGSMTGVTTHVIEELRTGHPLRIVLDHDLSYDLPKETAEWNGDNK